MADNHRSRTFSTKYGQDIKYRLVSSSRRKSLALEVDEQGLIVRVPRGTSEAEVHALLDQHSLWVLRKLTQFEKAGGQRLVQEPADGTEYYFQGSPYRLTLVPASPSFTLGEVRLNKELLELAVFPELVATEPELQIRQPLAAWYSNEATQLLPGLVEDYAARLELPAPPVMIRDQKRRWGSCSASGELRLNYRIVIPPPEVTEYIVAHEVCHLIELNHSPRFWETVATVVPDYKRLRRLLRQWEPKMVI